MGIRVTRKAILNAFGPDLSDIQTALQRIPTVDESVKQFLGPTPSSTDDQACSPFIVQATFDFIEKHRLLPALNFQGVDELRSRIKFLMQIDAKLKLLLHPTLTYNAQWCSVLMKARFLANNALMIVPPSTEDFSAVEKISAERTLVYTPEPTYGTAAVREPGFLRAAWESALTSKPKYTGDITGDVRTLPCLETCATVGAQMQGNLVELLQLIPTKALKHKILEHLNPETTDWGLVVILYRYLEQGMPIKSALTVDNVAEFFHMSSDIASKSLYLALLCMSINEFFSNWLGQKYDSLRHPNIKHVMGSSPGLTTLVTRGVVCLAEDTWSNEHAKRGDSRVLTEIALAAEAPGKSIDYNLLWFRYAIFFHMASLNFDPDRNKLFHGLNQEIVSSTLINHMQLLFRYFEHGRMHKPTNKLRWNSYLQHYLVSIVWIYSTMIEYLTKMQDDIAIMRMFEVLLNPHLTVHLPQISLPQIASEISSAPSVMDVTYQRVAFPQAQPFPLGLRNLKALAENFKQWFNTFPSSTAVVDPRRFSAALNIGTPSLGAAAASAAGHAAQLFPTQLQDISGRIRAGTIGLDDIKFTIATFRTKVEESLSLTYESEALPREWERGNFVFVNAASYYDFKRSHKPAGAAAISTDAVDMRERKMIQDFCFSQRLSQIETQYIMDQAHTNGIASILNFYFYSYQLKVTLLGRLLYGPTLDKNTQLHVKAEGGKVTISLRGTLYPQRLEDAAVETSHPIAHVRYEISVLSSALIGEDGFYKRPDVHNLKGKLAITLADSAGGFTAMHELQKILLGNTEFHSDGQFEITRVIAS